MEHLNDTIVKDLLIPVLLLLLKLLLASSCARAAATCARFAGTLRLPTYIHERKHIVMMNTDDDIDCRVHVNSRLAVLLTRSDGVDVVGVSLMSMAIA